MGVFNTIEHYDGSSWTLISEGSFDGTEPFYQDIWGTSATNIYAAAKCTFPPGEHGGCLDGFVYQYDGISWTTIYQAEPWLFGIWGISDTNVYAVGENGTVVQYNGTTWTVMDSGTEATLRGIWFDSPEDVFVVGDSGTIVHYDGIDWSPMTSGTTVSLRGIWGSSTTNVYAVGDNSTILHYDGIRWAQMNTGYDGGLCFAIWGYSETEIFVSCTGAVLRYDGDYDSDGFSDYLDNCPYITNPGQEDSYPPGGGNGLGDACDCEGNFNCSEDDDCDGSDAATFKIDFGRSIFSNPCVDGNPCNGDFICDGDVDGTDAALFKQDFGRSAFSNPCPMTETVVEWCVYP
jgi:hypothetical protein